MDADGGGAVARTGAQLARQTVMFDIEQQADYWRQGAQEDWDAGQALVERGYLRHGLFFVHLALEKIL